MKEPMIDFLYTLKDKHPSSSYILRNELDVFHRVMKYMQNQNLKPSKALIKKYKKSKTTKRLNKFPSFEDLSEIKMEKETYNWLEKRYSSKSDFVYFFDPDMDIQTKI